MGKRKFFLLILVLLGGILAWSRTWAAPQQAVTWPNIQLSSFASGYTNPTHLTYPGDGSGRLFIVEKGGVIKIHNTGVFLDLSSIVRSTGFEEGLLSIAFPENYEYTGHFYVFFTDARPGNDGNNVVARFHVDSNNPDLADPTSEEIILNILHPGRLNHNGGQLAFGPDGFLYISTGDGGGSYDPDENAQDLGSFLGKIHRVQVETPPLTSTPTPSPLSNKMFIPLIMNGVGPLYIIPPGNPFVGDPAALDEIWAYGLRNPWRFSFDRMTGDLWIADVGQDSFEEINLQLASSMGGENYGWDCREGFHEVTDPNGSNSDCAGKIFVDPVYEYQHVSGCYSVTGGFVYRGASYPNLSGIYFFSDWCQGKIWGLQKDGVSWVSQELADAGCNVNSFGEDSSGEIYVLCSSGVIYQIAEVVP